MSVEQAENDIVKVLSTSMDGFYIVSKNGMFLEVNEAYCKMIGYTREELLKMGVKDVEALETEEMIQRRIKKIFENGYDRFETKHKRKNGTLIEIEASVKSSNDGTERMFCFMHDITERKRKEEEERKILTQTSELNHLMIDRELRMAELKKENEELKAKLGLK
jgi:PAS domain S-box-containing protein